MKELSIEEKAKAYDKALEKAKLVLQERGNELDGASMLANLFPELAESEDEKIRKEIQIALKVNVADNNSAMFPGSHYTVKEAFAWLEKQGEQKPVMMIQWAGDNLQEVIRITGLSPNFHKWFKSWKDYEDYVHTHNNIFKLFNEDGSHYEVPVGAWIIKSPDGYNLASQAKFIPKPVEWSEEDKSLFDCAVVAVEYAVKPEAKCLDEEVGERVINWLKSLRPQKQQYDDEWSDEDKEFLKLTLSNLTELKDRYGEGYGRVGECIKWLNSLQPQPIDVEAVIAYQEGYQQAELEFSQKQQEWTQEDIDMIDWLIRCCEKEHEELCNDRYGHQDIVSDLKRDCRKKWDWLESLKEKVAPQKQWKPTEEQIRAVEEALSLAKNCGEEYSFDLRKLLEQLKAL